MKEITQLYVFLNLQKKKKLVGTVATIRGKIYFEYNPKFLKTALELSPFKLPLKSGAKENKDREFYGLFGVFYDSLIDMSDKNPLEQLINIQNVRGALEYRLDKKIQESEEDTLFKEFSLSQIVPSAKKQTLFIQVDRMKRKLLYSSESLETNFSHWILKVPAKNDISSSSKIEYAYSLMAKKAGLNIPNSYLFRTQTKHSYFGVQRFDRDTDNNSFHIHSLGGLIHSDAKLSSLDYDDFLSITLTLTKNVKDLQKAFRVVCFNILSHNKDDNQNNLIFIMDMLGDWHLAPASNLTFSYGNSGKHHMKVMGENSWIRINHLIKLAKSHDIRNYQEILDEVSSAISSWTSFAKIANVPQEESLKIETILNKINLSF